MCPPPHKTGLRIGRGWGEAAEEDGPDEQEQEQQDDDDDDDDALGLKPLGRGGQRRGRRQVGSRRRGGRQQQEQGEEGGEEVREGSQGLIVTVAALPNVCFSSALALLQLGRGEGAFLGVCLGVVDG